MRRIVCVVVASAMVSACATTTTINSRPPGARVYVEDQYLGDTPVPFSDSSAFWTKRTAVLKEDGYQDKTVVLKKNELRTDTLIGTVFLLVPVFWLFGYPSNMTFELDPLHAEAPKAQR